MKNLRFILIIAVSLAVAVSASAQSKVASVDMKKLFNGYWKTKQAETLLDKDKADARKNLKDMADGIDKATTDYKALLDQSSDPVISADERAKRKQAADDKAKEISSSKVAFQQFQRQVESTLADKSQRMSGNLVTEIQQHVADKAKLGGYTLVVNSANPEAVVYVNPDNDITDSVLKSLNDGAPIDVSGSSNSGGALPFNISTNLP